MQLYEELKRRNVVRIGLGYLTVAWLLIQVLETLFPIWGMPETSIRVYVTVLAIGFIPTLIASWVFELTPAGLVRDSDRTRPPATPATSTRHLDRCIMLALALALGLFAFDKFIISPEREAERLSQARIDARTEAFSQSYGDRSIAVLPFENMSGDASNAYFSDGITEEILNLLAKIPELRVVSHSSAFAYKGKEIHVPEVAKKLNVAHVLEGSVRRFDDRVRITTQLIDARSDTHLWSETYDHVMEDIFAVQDEIARAVTVAMKLALMGETPVAEVTGTQAYELFLHARHFYRQRSQSGYEKVIEYAKKVIALDPDYAPAWGTLGGTYTIQADSGWIPYDEGYKLALEANARALLLDPEYHRARVLRGWIAMRYEHDFALAAQHFRHALSLQPNDSVGLANSATFAHTIGRLHQAIKLQKLSLMLNPTSPVPYVNLAQIYNALGMLEEAEAAARKALELNSGITGASAQLAVVSILRGEPELALEQAEAIILESRRGAILAIAHHELGNIDESDRLLNLLLSEHADTSAYHIAMVYGWRENSDSAFKWLRQAVDEGQKVDAIKTDALLENLHQDPRWEELLIRIGLADSQVAAIERMDFGLTAMPRSSSGSSASNDSG